MSQQTSLLAGLALGQQTCFVKYNINVLACSAPGRQTCRLAHVRFCLKNWANGWLSIFFRWFFKTTWVPQMSRYFFLRALTNCKKWVWAIFFTNPSGHPVARPNIRNILDVAHQCLNSVWSDRLRFFADKWPPNLRILSGVYPCNKRPFAEKSANRWSAVPLPGAPLFIKLYII
jgi:hypothetical protein